MKITLKIDTSNMEEIKKALLLLSSLGTTAPKLAAAGRKAASARKALAKTLEKDSEVAETEKAAKIAEEAEKNSIPEDSGAHTLDDAKKLVSDKVSAHRVGIRSEMKALGVDKVSKLTKAQLPEFIGFLKGLK